MSNNNTRSSSWSSLDVMLRCTIRWILFLTVLLVPLVFYIRISDVFELPKQTLLSGAALVALALMLLRTVAARRFTWLPTRGSGWVAVYVAVTLASAFFSVHWLTSFLGDHGQQWGSVLTLMSLVVFAIVAVQELDARHWQGILTSFLLGSLTSSLLFLFGLWGVYLLPWQGTRVALFTPVGDIVTLAVLAAAALLVASSQFFVRGVHPLQHESQKRAWRARISSFFLLLVIVVCLVLLAVVGSKTVWGIVLLSELLLYFLIVGRANELTATNRWTVIFAVVVIALFFLVMPGRFGRQLLPFLFMSWGESTNVVLETLRSSPLLGSGPSTFSVDVSRYHTAQSLRDNFGVLFDRSRSGVLTQVAQVGALGVGAWLALLAAGLLVPAIRMLSGKSASREWATLVSAMSGWMVAVIAFIVFPSTTIIEWMFWLFSAGMLWAFNSGRQRLEWSLGEYPRTRIALLSTTVVVILFLPLAGWMGYARWAANAAFAQSRNATLELDARINAVRSAVQRYPRQDVYQRQGALLQLTKFFNVLRTEEASPARLQRLRLLSQDAIVSALRATQLHPNSVASWQALSNVYQQLIPYVEGAQGQTIVTLKKLRELEPNNPVHITDLASLYLIAADQEAARGQESNKEAIANMLADAENLLNEALAVDDRFAPAHFQQAIILERRGQLGEAIAKVEELARKRSNDLPLHLQLGALYYRNGQKDLAEKVWNAVIARNEKYANARWYLANLYEEQQRYNDALQQLEEIQKTNMDNAQLAERIEDIRSKAESPVAPSIPPLDPKIPFPSE